MCIQRTVARWIIIETDHDQTAIEIRKLKFSLLSSCEIKWYISRLPQKLKFIKNYKRSQGGKQVSSILYYYYTFLLKTNKALKMRFSGSFQ